MNDEFAQYLASEPLPNEEEFSQYLSQENPNQQQGGRQPVNPVMNVLNQISRQADRFGHGVAQPWVESGIFGEQAKKNLHEAEAASKARAIQSAEGNPISTELGGAFGKQIKNLPGMAIGGGGGKELLGQSPKLFKYLASILGSGTMGFLQGHGTEYVNPGESRMANGITQGVANAATTAIAPPLAFLGQKGAQLAKDTGKLIKHFPEALDTSGLAKQYAAAEKAVNKASSNQFNAIKNASTESNILTTPPKILKDKHLNKGLDKDIQETIRNYEKSRDIPSAHDAYVDLGKFVRYESDRLEKGLLSTKEKDVLKMAKKARDELSDAMHSAFKKYGRHDLSDALTDANNYYVKKVLAYENPLTGIYKQTPKKLTESTYINRLSRSEPFQANLAQEHPALAIKGQIPGILGKLGGVGATGYGLNYLFGGRNNE